MHSARTSNGIALKPLIVSLQGGSGSAQGFIFRNVKMNDVSNPIIIDQYYCDSSTPCQNQVIHISI
jgi:galacturan 1,4-alpha-galacturonidase